jgi:hypothetical protein
VHGGDVARLQACRVADHDEVRSGPWDDAVKLLERNVLATDWRLPRCPQHATLRSILMPRATILNRTHSGDADAGAS